MPFSRSRSVESMTRSATSSLARKAPDWRSMASTSVVLPWSTWAMMATLRMSARCIVLVCFGGCRRAGSSPRLTNQGTGWQPAPGFIATRSSGTTSPVGWASVEPRPGGLLTGSAW